MNNKSDIFKKTLLAIVFVILFIHIIYREFKFIKIPSLKGDVNYAQKPILNNSTWFLGEFQEKQNEYINDMFGFRSLYVRLHNQIDFSIFNKIHASGVVLGKDNYLFEENYINSYYGKDFMGADSISHLVSQIKFVSNAFAKMGKQLIVIFAADKASYYPEFMPGNYFKINDSTNYKFLSSAAKNDTINIIDFNKWFIENKRKSKYPLYPKYGTHWSNYGAVLAADSIINYIQYLRQIDIPNLIYDKIDLKQPIYTDYDIADGMNLLFRFKSFDMAYPRISTQDNKGKTRPSVLVISDSFYWDMFYFGISKSFKDDHFWYYNKLVYPESNKKNLPVENLNFENEINKHDVFIVMASASNLNKLGWGFFDNAEDFFKIKSGIKSANTNIVNQTKQKIKSDPVWMEQIKQKAEARRISIDSMMTIDALWFIKEQKIN